MNAQVKSGVESAVIAVLAAAVCLWMLITASQMDPTPVSRIALTGIGLASALAAHVAFMMRLVRLTGRRFWPWFIAVVVFAPLGSAVLLAMLFSEPEQVEKVEKAE